MFWLTYAVPVLQWVVISGRVWDWQAGPTIGARYLAPILPLLALPCAIGVMRWPRLGLALATYSILITSVATLTDACPAYETRNPLSETMLPALMEGQLSPNLGMLAGLPAHGSAVAFFVLMAGGGAWLQCRLSSDEASLSHACS